MYVSPFTRKTYPKVQILTIEELLNDPDRPNPRCLQIPAGDAGATLPKVEKHRSRGPKQKGLEF